MVYNIQNADIINYIVNDPSVKPHMDPSGKYANAWMDYSDAIGNSRYLFLGNYDATCMVLAENWSPGTWELHTAALPQARGKTMLEHGKAVIDWFWDIDQILVYGQTPVINRAARLFNLKCGMWEIGEHIHFISGPVITFAKANPKFNLTKEDIQKCIIM